MSTRVKNISLTDKAYEEIKKLIVLNHLKPGELISEAQLQEMLGIGRTPVHEALLRLTYEQLVTILPRKGIQIARVSPQRIHDIFNVRLLVEPAVLKEKHADIDKEWLSEMRAQFIDIENNNVLDTLEGIMEYLQKDCEFHMNLIKSYKNQYLSDMVNNYISQLLMISIATTRHSERAYTTNHDHINIIDAILEGNISMACNTLEEHIRVAHVDVIKNYINFSF